MMPTLCATMSCSSRAIRSRSASAVWVAAWARSASALAWARRIEFPISQASDRGKGEGDRDEVHGRSPDSVGARAGKRRIKERNQHADA